MNAENIPVCIVCLKTPAEKVRGRWLPCAGCRGSMKKFVDPSNPPKCSVCGKRKAFVMEEGLFPCNECQDMLKEAQRKKKIRKASWDDPVTKTQEIIEKHHAGLLPKSYYEKNEETGEKGLVSSKKLLG